MWRQQSIYEIIQCRGWKFLESSARIDDMEPLCCPPKPMSVTLSSMNHSSHLIDPERGHKNTNVKPGDQKQEKDNLGLVPGI